MSVSLNDATSALERIAPLRLAEEWDNVGLLIEPSEPVTVGHVLLTIDLTDAVAAEAIERGVQLLIAYHPPIFNPLKRIDGRLMRLAEKQIAVYSPHTALDAVSGGVNDWLCDGLGCAWRSPLVPERTLPQSQRIKIVTFVPAEHADEIRNALARTGAGHIGDYSHCSFNVSGFGTFLGGNTTDPAIGEKGRLERVDEIRIEMVCHEPALGLALAELRRIHPYEEPAIDIYRLEPHPMCDTGPGRRAHMENPISLDSLVERVKQHLQLNHVRVAAPDGLSGGKETIQNIAVCAGAGASVFENTYYDAYLTGEMRHHDILAKVEQGATVILTDHTNTERGYLPTLKQKLHDELGDSVTIDISKVDADPLRIV